MEVARSMLESVNSSITLRENSVSWKARHLDCTVAARRDYSYLSPFDQWTWERPISQYGATISGKHVSRHEKNGKRTRD
jgi:hypothetical protein